MDNDLSQRVAKISRELEAMKGNQPFPSNGLTANNIQRQVLTSQEVGYDNDSWTVVFVPEGEPFSNREAAPLFQIGASISYTGMDAQFFRYFGYSEPYVTADGWVKATIYHNYPMATKKNATLSVVVYCPYKGSLSVERSGF